MKKLLLILTAIALVLFPAYAGVERLVGSWKSNKEATVEHARKHTKMTQEQLDRLAAFSGRTTFTFDTTNLTLVNRKWTFVSKYKIVKERKKVIIIESTDPRTGKPAKMTLEMDTNGFWNPDDTFKGYKERFDRVKE